MNIWEQNYHVEATPSTAVTSTSVQRSDSSTLNASSLNASTLNPNSNRPFSLIDLALLMVVGVMCLSAACLTIGKISWAYRRKSREQSFRIKQADTMLCQRCQYFCANPYLKCTVHPVTVMTEASSDCIDYSPQVR
jgi:hypothetical protein